MIEFVQLQDVKKELIIDLMNNELVGLQMPLLRAGFSTEQYRLFLMAKQQLWEDHGFGPWAFLIDGQFAGWGGLQPEQGDADFALVLHPDFWGWGRRIFEKVRERAFGEMELASITILLPPSRPNSKAITRLGFFADGELKVDGEKFLRFRLNNPRAGDA